MIVKMSKYLFVCYYNDFDPFLERLQTLGIVDVESRNVTLSKREKQKLHWLKLYKECISELSVLKKQRGIRTKTIHRKPVFMVHEYLRLKKERAAREMELKRLQKTNAEFEVWGNYDPKTLEQLRKAGLYLHFFVCDRARFSDEWTKNYPVEIIHEDARNKYFILIASAEEPIAIDAVELFLPEQSHAERLEKVESLSRLIAIINEKLIALSAYVKLIEADLKKLESAAHFDRITTHADAAAEDKVRILTGYVPEAEEPKMLAGLKSADVYYEKQTIEAEDDVPIELKNNRFAKNFEFITKLFALPAYRELDLTPFFAPFFMMFFGFCLGDAGYGILIIIGAVFAKFKLKKDLQSFANLALYFGLATIVFGLLSGTFLGISLVEVPALAKFKNYFFDQNNMMALAFGLGAVQVVFGMGVNITNIIIRKNWKYAVGNIGWMVFLLSAAACFGLPMLNILLPQLVIYILQGFMGIGLLSAFFYNNPDNNIFTNFGLGIWNAYNVATGLLGDLLSYVRLFALGLTGGILGSVFNTLAMDAGSGIPYVGWFFTILILLAGHSLNFALNILGALVHPMRLTFVEFYKNAGFEGNGREYKPFKKL